MMIASSPLAVWRPIVRCRMFQLLGMLCACVTVAEAAFPTIQMKLAYPELTLNRPLWLCEAPDGSHRLFVLEQPGRVLILPKDRNGKETNVFLDISARKPYAGNEEGLLGMAFHPQFQANGKFYIYYTQHNPRRSVLSEMQISKSDANAADAATE